MKTTKNIEIYTVTTGDISVIVKIDYINNEISLLDQEYSKKEYVFAKRGVEYMNGWLNVLEAMDLAIRDAKKRYEADLAENSKFEKEAVKKVGKIIDRLRKK